MCSATKRSERKAPFNLNWKNCNFWREDISKR
jgi:hypothetical protein